MLGIEPNKHSQLHNQYLGNKWRNKYRYSIELLIFLVLNVMFSFIFILRTNRTCNSSQNFRDVPGFWDKSAIPDIGYKVTCLHVVILLRLTGRLVFNFLFQQ